MEAIEQKRTLSFMATIVTVVNGTKAGSIRRPIPRPGFLLAFLLTVFLISMTALGQAPDAKRGFQAGGSYALSDIETISTTNGNLMLRFPLGNLAAGRGGLGGNLTLFYDSKIYDVTPVTEEDHNCEPTSEFPKRLAQRELLTPSATGGWHYSSFYRLDVKDRLEAVNYDPEQGPHYPDDAALARWKLVMIFPDGSTHQFQQRGYTQIATGDGYSSVRADGLSMIWGAGCNGHTYCPDTSQISGPIFYYSTDGSYLRLVVNHDSDNDAFNNSWTLYFPDGGKVTSPTTSSGVTHQLTYDRNGNSVDFQALTLSNSHSALRVADPVTGRYTQLELNADDDEDWITQKGVGGTEIKWRIKWKNIQVVREYRTVASWNLGSGCDTSGYPSTLQTALRIVDQIILPEQVDGELHYSFGYNGPEYTDTFQTRETTGWGELSSITLPSGAFAEYAYKLDDQENTEENEIWTGTVQMNSPTSKMLHYDLEYDGDSSGTTETWTYDMHLPNDPAEGGYSVITGPDGGETTETFDKFHNVTRSEQPDGTVVERIWAQNVPESYPVPLPGLLHTPQSANFYLKTEFTTLENFADSQVLTAIKDFDYDKNGNTTAVREYGFVAASTIPRDGNGVVTGIPSGISPLRISAGGFHAATPVATNSTTTDADAYYTYQVTGTFKLLRSAQWSEIQNGSGTPQSRSEIYYDGATAYSTAPAYGNPTKQLAWDSDKGGTTRTYSDPLTTTNANTVTTAYNSYGMPTLITGANGVETQITYGSITGPSASYSDLYPTQTVTAYGTGVAKTSTAAYDFYTGAVTTATDVDNGVSTVTTYDVFGRPTLVKGAYNTSAETRTAIAYHDEGRFVVTRSDLNVAGDGKIVKIQHYDQLGRARLNRVLEDPAQEDPEDELDGIKVQTRYGIENGYTYQISSNPYRAAHSYDATSESTMGWTRSKSLTDGSRSEMETFSGVGLPAPAGSNSSSTGPVVTLADANKTYVRDQAGKWRMSETNALGQLVKVTEDPTSSLSGYTHTGTDAVTDYTYDTLSNLTGVSMPYSGGNQTRSFSYSSLSRLLSASNPESGTINYQYDPNGNLTEKEDARGVTTEYTYDELNRPTLREYSDSTPDVTYTYDSASVPFGEGRLASVSNGVSTTEYTKYDQLGRILASQQTIDGLDVCSGGDPECLMTYKYNLAGQLTEETYPSGRIVHHNYAADGKLRAVSSRLAANKPSKSYAQNLSYNAAGAVTDLQLGNMRWENTEFNARMQPTKIALGTTVGGDDLLNLVYGYGTTANNGNVISQTIKVENVGATQGFEAVQTYTYDEVNRLKSATEMNTPNSGSQSQSWKQTYLFDRFGNRRFDASSGATTTIPGTCSTDVCNPTFNLANNRFAGSQGYDYDATGNVTEDASGKKFAYDAENKQKSFGTGGSSTDGGTYIYDGDGNRVKKVVGPEVTIFVYNAANQLIAEYNTTAPVTPQVRYLTYDALSTPRVNSDGNGAVAARHDYMPFGEEIYNNGNRTTGIGYGGDTVRQKFTGYQRDTESDLDYATARYFNHFYGRFYSADPSLASGREQLPESWNRYCYALSNPLRFTDPLGLYEFDDSFDDTQKANFRLQVADAAKRLKAIEKIYTKNSDEYRDAKSALDAIGCEAGARGCAEKVGQSRVIIHAGTLDEGVGAQEVRNADGKTVTIIVDANKMRITGIDIVGALAHEGLHAADDIKYIDSGKTVKVSDYQMEFRAYVVTSIMDEVYATHSTRDMAGKSYTMWDMNWRTKNPKLKPVENVRSARKESIDSLLAVPKSENGMYGFTEKEPGSSYEP
jgi:RHS repeat-associated protein